MPNVVAHRGASLQATENTLSAYRLAAKVGAAMIELDIRRSLDGQIVVYHDAAIPVPGECERLIERLTLADLQAIPLANDEHIPTFEDVLSVCRECNLGLYIEFKDTSERLTAHLIDLLKTAGLLDQSILFGARPDHIVYAKQIEPAARTCLSYRQAGIDPILMAQACRADGLNLAWEDYPDPLAYLTPEWLGRVRGAGLRLMSWHEERAAFLSGLIALGIDDLCTNDPALAHRLVVEAAQKDWKSA